MIYGLKSTPLFIPKRTLTFSVTGFHMEGWDGRTQFQGGRFTIIRSYEVVMFFLPIQSLALHWILQAQGSHEEES